MRVACIGCGRPGDDVMCEDCRPSGATWYMTRAWRKRRAAFLRRHPECIDCGRAARVADHYPISRLTLLARGVADPDREEYLVPRCIACHDRRASARGRTVLTNDSA